MTTTTIRFLISDVRNLELRTFCDVAGVCLAHRRIVAEFSREKKTPGVPAKRWRVVRF